MTKQKIFNKVYKHLLTQKKKSMIDDSEAPNGYRCLYRGKDGLKCAIGALIPDRLYNVGIENMGISYLMSRNADIAKYLGRSHTFFLSELQSIHDSSFHTPAQWEDKLKMLAKTHDLTIPK